MRPIFLLAARVAAGGPGPPGRTGAGQPVYFSEVTVCRGSSVRTFSELRERSRAYTDPCFLSGYYSMLKKLTEIGEGDEFFCRVCCSESCSNSVEMAANGELNAAAIDANVLKIQFESHSELGERLRIIESWRPFPIHPIVTRSNLDPDLTDRLRTGLLKLSTNLPPVLAGFGLKHFAPVTYEHYASEEQALRKCERTNNPPL